MLKKIGVITLFLALCGPGTRSALALGTPSGTSISNTATATYNYGGASLTTTVTTDIVVDNKVNLTVTKNADQTVSPGSVNQALLFNVKNDGNTTQRYALTTIKSAGIDMDPPVRIYLDNGTTPGVWDAGDTLYADASTFGDVLADGSLKVLIVANTPAGATGGQIADYQLLATTVNAGTTTVTTQTAGANTAGVDVVFADAAGVAAGDIIRDGKHSDKGTYTVNVLALVLNKTVLVVSDPYNLLVNPKAVPGAVLTYTITATVTGAGTAAAVVITDPIPANSTYVLNSLKLNGAGLSDIADGDVGKVVGALVTVGLGDLTSASPPQAVSFDVTIN